MKNAFRLRLGFILMISFLSLSYTQAQVPGFINRVATSTTGKAILDLNNDGYTSKTTSGFGTDDVGNSEIPYKIVRSFSVEPFGDLRRGPSHLYSDFVPDNGSNGFYTYYDGTNLLFRFRVGSVMSGAKGYSVLLDTDGKFGASGTNADPNYLPATTGTNGNPGFEIEIVLETNSRIAIYNVDGTSSPTLVKSYTNWQDMSQISIAASNDNGDPDFFIDFYIPFSDLTTSPFNLTTSSPLRLSSTTVMAPQAAIGGPKSDIYGVNDGIYPTSNSAYEAYVTSEPAFTVTSISSTGSGMGPMCTNAPVVNSPLSTGIQTIYGTWTMSSVSGAVNKTTIAVYKNGVFIDSVYNVTSGSTWQLPNVSLAANDIITAQAKSRGESMCQISNAVIATSCTSVSRPAQPVLTCSNNYGKGVSGNNLSTGWVVYVENLTRGTTETSTGTPAQFTTSGTSPNITWNYAGGCSGGPNMPSGTYRIYYMNASGCASEPVSFCISTGSGNSNNLAGNAATPVITSPSTLTPGTSTISGTGEANGTVTLYVDGTAIKTTTTSSTGTFSFTGLALTTGQVVYITNYLTVANSVSSSKCLTQSANYTVNCFTTPPLINSDNNGQIIAGNPITGTSSEPAGTIIKVYTSANSLVATTTVQSGGTWSTANSGTTPSTYNSVSGTTYYATAQNGSCGLSANSSNAAAVSATASTRCGTITGPVTASATSISGSLSGSFTSTTVNLYLDGINIGTTSTNTSSWGPITVNTTINNSLYANGTLTIGIQETGKAEYICTGSALKIDCSPSPAAPVVSPTNYSINANQSVTYTISNATAGTFYGIADATTGLSLASGKWAPSNGNLSITTNSFPSSGTYNVVVKATSLSGVTMCGSQPSAASVSVSTPVTLPVVFLNVSAVNVSSGVQVTWKVLQEINVDHYVVERSFDGYTFIATGTVGYIQSTGSENQYRYIDPIGTYSKVYYRIRQIDKNGSSHYSNIVRLSKAAAFEAKLLPNPAHEKATLQLSGSATESLSIQMIDMNGKTLMSKNMVIKEGENDFTLDGLTKYAKGQYLLKLSTSKEEQHIKFIIQ